MRLVIMAPLLLVGLLGASAPALAADRQCGSVTAVGLSDPVSGGSLAIDDRLFRVAGLGRNVLLPPVTTPDGLQTLFHVGARACVEGDFRVLADGTVDVTNGSVSLDPSVPAGVVTSADTALLLLIALGVLLLAVLVLFGLFVMKRRRRNDASPVAPEARP